jgi:hypothetical protein
MMAEEKEPKGEHEAPNYDAQIESIRAQRMAEFLQKLEVLEKKYSCQVSTRVIMQPGLQPIFERVILTTN